MKAALSSADLAHWEALLRGVNPLAEAKRLANTVLDPMKATAEECWTRIWDKPLFSNTRVAIGEKALKALGPFMNQAWRDWGTSGGAIQISHLGGYNRRENFRVTGRDAETIDGLKIARHRLFAIQGGASMLRALVAENPSAPFKPFAGMDRAQMVTQIQSRAGRGWGHITALHLLTDFGLAVKPDLHLVRTAQALGLLPVKAKEHVPTLKDALKINDMVDSHGQRIFGTDYGPSNRRYLDKILMELSRQGLLAEIELKDNQ
jgi:hypothetical protein